MMESGLEDQLEIVGLEKMAEHVM